MEHAVCSFLLSFFVAFEQQGKEELWEKGYP